MPTTQCLENIAKQPPPANHYCPGTTCADIQATIDKYCKSHGMQPDAPYATFANNGSGKCFCCCDQAAAAAVATPVEVEDGVYRRGDTLQAGDRVRATGPSLHGWSTREVTHVGGAESGAALVPTLYGEFRLESGQPRMLIATADHLFLDADAGEPALVSFARLRPGDRVRAADGGVATVVLTAWIRFSGPLRHVALGSFERGDALDGHLLNTNGLVTADLAVQLSAFSGAAGDVLAAADEPPALGSAEFHARYDTAAWSAFMADPSRWPPLCEPLDGRPQDAASPYQPAG